MSTDDEEKDEAPSSPSNGVDPSPESNGSLHDAMKAAVQSEPKSALEEDEIPEGDGKIYPFIRFAIVVDSKDLDEPLELEYQYEDETFVEEVPMDLLDVLDVLPKDVALRVALRVYPDGGGKGHGSRTVCFKKNFLRLTTRMSLKIIKRYWFVRAKNDPRVSGEDGKRDKPVEKPIDEDALIGAGMDMLQTATEAANAINEIAAARPGEVHSIMNYIGNPAIAKLFQDDKAFNLIAQLFQMQSVLDAVRAIGGPMHKISFIINMYTAMKAGNMPMPAGAS